MVFRDATAFPVQEAETGLTVSVSLFGGFAEPRNGLLIVSRDAATVFIHLAETGLGVSISSLGGGARVAEGRRKLLLVFL